MAGRCRAILEPDRPGYEPPDCQRSGCSNVAVTKTGRGTGPQIEMRLEERSQSPEIDPHQIQEEFVIHEIIKTK